MHQLPLMSGMKSGVPKRDRNGPKVIGILIRTVLDILRNWRTSLLPIFPIFADFSFLKSRLFPPSKSTFKSTFN